MDDSLATDCAHVSLVELRDPDGNVLIRCADCGATLRLWSAGASPAERSDASAQR